LDFHSEGSNLTPQFDLYANLPSHRLTSSVYQKQNGENGKNRLPPASGLKEGQLDTEVMWVKLYFITQAGCKEFGLSEPIEEGG